MFETAEWISKNRGCVAPWKTSVRDDDAEEAFAKRAPVEVGSTLYRTAFRVKKNVRTAKLAICGLGFYETFVNGRRPDEKRVLAPVPSDYYLTARYDTYDVTALLRTGENVLAAEVCCGWFAPAVKWQTSWQMIWYATPRMVAQLDIVYKDGSTDTVVSDENWKWSEGTVLSSCVYDGETVDFTREQKGWNEPGFSDSAWKNAVRVEQVSDTMQEAFVPPVRVIRALSPVTVRQLSENEYLYDFGENHTAQPEVIVRGKRGTTVCLRHAEFVFPDGSLNRESESGAACTDLFTLSGEENVCRPRFTWHGYRYMTVTLSDPETELLSVKSLQIHSDVAVTGTFSCSREDFNRLHEAYLRTELACLQGYPVDCPQRHERKGWLGDAHVTSELCFYNLDMRLLYASWFLDMKTARNPDTKRINIICPDYSSPDSSIDWNIAYPILLSEYDQRYGDTELLAKHYDTLCEHTDSYAAECENGFVKPCWFGDWFSVDFAEDTQKVAFAAGHERHRQNPPFAATMFYCQTLRLTAEIAERLGKTADAEKYRGLWEISRDALIERCYDAETGIFGSGGQFLLTYALAEHLVPENDRERVFANLLAEFEKENYHTLFGVVGLRRIWDVLREFDRPDIGYKLLSAEGYPSPLYMLTGGRTTLTEGLDGSGSGCHCMFASPDTYFYRTLCGVSVDRRKRVPLTIRPYCPEDMTDASCTQTLDEGTLSVRWERTENGITYSIRIPAGLTADVLLKNGAHEYRDSCAEGNISVVL